MRVLLIILFIQFCSIIPKTQEFPEEIKISGWNISSDDPILENVFRKKFSKEGTLFSGNRIHLNVRIEEESQNVFSNILYSILYLTLYFRYDTSASWVYEITLFEKNEKRTVFFNSGSYKGVWSLMPFYIGTVSTVLASALDRHRLPSHLQKYCLEDPGKVRELFEQKREDNCREYSEHLYQSLYLASPVWRKLIRNRDHEFTLMRNTE